MITITEEAAIFLRRRLVDAYTQAGGLSTIAASPLMGRLIEANLVRAFQEAGLGFRIQSSSEQEPDTGFTLNVDAMHDDDEVWERDGVNILVDPANAAMVNQLEATCIDVSAGGLALR